MTPTSEFDIAIVGMGPVGSAAAILFADAGLKVAAFERDVDIYPLPRAVAMDGEVVRAFQRVGRGEAVARLLQPIRPGDRAGFANSKREWLFGQTLSDFGANGWPGLSMFDQPEVDGYLRGTAVAHDNVTAHIGCLVDQVVDTGDEIVVHATDTASGSQHRTTARYLVACDGAGSGTRRALGVGWEDLGYDHDWLVVDITLRDGHTLGVETLQVCDPDRLTTFVATKDPYRRWEFKLNAGETAEEMLAPDRIHALIDPWTPRDTYEIRRSAVYQFHAATADRWRINRVLLAGDAAHQTPPFLGQGMNAGMRDIINLAWKFPLVLSGTADEALLDSYEAERRAHAQDLVEWAVAVGQLMEHLAAAEAAERSGRTPPPAPANTTSSGYGQGREAPPLRDGVIVTDQVSDEGSTGYLFRQPIVCDGRGKEFRLDAKLGQGFAIVGRTARDLQMNDASRALVETLGIATASLEGLSEVRGHFDRLFTHAAAAIVRPDRYVFGHTTDTLNLDMLLTALATKLHLH